MERSSNEDWHAPYWDTKKHGSAWERVKEALRRDWEQTKADVSTKGKELNQSAGDTLAQAAGAAPIPPGGQPNPTKVNTLFTPTWSEVEPGVSYGFGAAEQYGTQRAWDPELEKKLAADWDEEKTGQSFEEARAHIRRGWEAKR